MQKLLAIFAHPDDEGAISGTLARYARQGVDVALICTTRGEAGQISDPTLATPETLGEVRTAELEAACEIIGIRELHFLGYRDSGMAGTPDNQNPASLAQANPEVATGQLVAHVRRLQPDVVITFEPFGWYGHPDHQITSRLATAAYKLAGQATAYPEMGAPWQPQKLFHAVIAVTFFEAMMDYAKANNIDVSNFERLPLDVMRETETQVTHRLDVRDFYELKQAVRQVHRTQFGENNLFQKLPQDITRQIIGYEHFIQVYPPPTESLRQDRAEDLVVA